MCERESVSVCVWWVCCGSGWGGREVSLLSEWEVMWGVCG